MSTHIFSHKDDIKPTKHFFDIFPWVTVGAGGLTSFIFQLCQGGGQPSAIIPTFLLTCLCIWWPLRRQFYSPTQQKRQDSFIKIFGAENRVDRIKFNDKTTGDDLVSQIADECKLESPESLTVLFAGQPIDGPITLASQGLENDSGIVVLLHENGVELPWDEAACIAAKKAEEKARADAAANDGDDDEDSDDDTPTPNLFGDDEDEEDDDDSDSDSDVSDIDRPPPTNNSRFDWQKRSPITVDDADMITLEQGGDVRFSMGCSDADGVHALTQSSLLAYLKHHVENDRKHEIECPKCSRVWYYPYIRQILTGHVGFTDEIRLEIEKKLSANLISKQMNAQRCSSCSVVLRRSIANTSFAASCVGCGDETFCWACRTPWKKGAVACLNAKCPSWVREVTCAVLKKCPTKFIDHMPDVPVLRACPTCGQLITHISDCKHMDCPICNRSFCFVCVTPADEYGNYQCGYDVATCPLADRQTKDDVVPTGLRSYSSILGLPDSERKEQDSTHCQSVEEIDAEMGSNEFYEKFAQELVDNLQAAGWDGEDYDDDDY